MAASSSSAVAVDPSLHKYDVFISFRGETRNSFTSHLSSKLREKRIKAYIDEVSLDKGEDISRALPKAIEESAIAIIIFSENYADSRWCLDELVHILKCREVKDQIVLPVFYGIDPSHIRHQKGTYDAAFLKHQVSFKDNIVQQWRQALSRAADLSGWDSRGKSESVLLKQVVEDVISKLQSISPKSIDDLKGLVGIQERLEKIKSFLDSPTGRVLGIWGMGGIGKTTLAGVVFKRFSNRFEGACFLENVREESQRKGLVQLEKEVFSKLLGEEDPDVFNHFVNVRLSRTKALLVLDDVDNFYQLERLAGDRGRFGPGSKIILTSRDLKVLNQLIDVRYKVQALGLNEASQLFYLKAFKENSCRTGFEEISRRVVEYTKGHPLALKVLGASVFGSLESIQEWEEELEELKIIPNADIQVVLKRSYDALDDKEKGLFLDIACFFKGERRDFVEGILEGKPIRGLVDKSLITIEHGRIHMHDLIQEMGRKLGERSRLWIAKDVSDVLENNKGTKAIEGMCLYWTDELKLRPDVFKEMCELRLLTIPPHNLCIDGDLNYLPNSLRYLHWEYYPGKSLASDFKPRNLVKLHMPYSKLEQLWDGVQELGSLKHINLRGSRLLTKIPDLSLAPKLECINLYGCRSLIHIPSLNLNLQATVDESTYRRDQWLGDQVLLSYFETKRIPGCIILNGCLVLTTLPKVSGNIRKLVLRRTALKELPSSIESLENLLHLDLRWCSNLKSLPNLPRNIEVLLLNHSGIEQIPSSSIEGLCSLPNLSLCYCRSLSSLEFNINLKALKKLEIIETSIQELPPTIGMLYNLEYLDIIKCRNLLSLSASIGELYKLKKLYIRKCENLESLPELPLFIEFVYAGYCSSLKTVSTSRSTLTLGRWLDKYDIDNDQREFSFLNCANLDKDATNNIFREFLYKVFCTSTTPPEVIVSNRAIGKLLVCYPTEEIPSWFVNQSEGSSTTIELLPNWYNPKTFLGFVVSVVVGKDKDDHALVKFKDIEDKDGHALVECKDTDGEDDDFFYDDYLDEYEGTEGEDVDDFDEDFQVECELRLKTKTEEDLFGFGGFDYMVKSGSDHIVMWYVYFHHSEENVEKFQEASILELFCVAGRVKRCGVRMLYLIDAVEESDDGTPANFESWRIDSDTDYATTYDSDEPPPKRTRNL